MNLKPEKKLLNLILLFAMLSPAVSQSHPGGRDANGGHYCREKCEEYGLEVGQYHRHEPGTNKLLPEEQQEPPPPDTEPSAPKPDNLSGSDSWSMFKFTFALSGALCLFCWFVSMLVKLISKGSKLIWRQGRKKKNPDK